MVILYKQLSLCYNNLSINIMERQLQDIFQQILTEYMVPSTPAPTPVPVRVPGRVTTSVPRPASTSVPTSVRAPTRVPTSTRAPSPVPGPGLGTVPTPTPGTVPEQRTSSRTELYDADPSIQNLHIIDAMSGMMDDYRQIMNGYNDNIYTMLNIIRDGIVPVNSQSRTRRSNSNRTTTNTTSRPIYTNTQPRQTTSTTQPIFTYLFYPERTRQNFDNVVVRPTQQQIDDATERITYSIEETNVNTSCPITLEEFQEGDILTKIKPCSHIFRERSIQEWFLSNVRCPVCRYDIRDYAVDASLNVPSASSRTNNNNNNNTVNETIDSILDNFSQQFSTAIFNNFMDLSGNTRMDITLEEEMYLD